MKWVWIAVAFVSLFGSLGAFIVAMFPDIEIYVVTGEEGDRAASDDWHARRYAK